MSIDGIGVPGQPLGTPPLTVWQAAVRDAIKANETGLAVLTPSAGWVDYTTAPGMYVTRQGRLVTIDAALSPTSNLAVTAGSGIVIATIPAGFRPARGVTAPGWYNYAASGMGAAAKLIIGTDGTVSFIPTVAGTINAGTNSVAIPVSYRSA